MINVNKYILCLMVITSILLNGCASMQTHWESAKTENTVEAYTKFLKDYPNSPYYKEAVSDFINLLITSKHSDYHWNSEPGKTLLWLGADAVDELMNVLPQKKSIDRYYAIQAFELIKDEKPNQLENHKIEFESPKEVTDQDIDTLIIKIESIIVPFNFKYIVTPLPYNKPAWTVKDIALRQICVEGEVNQSVKKVTLILKNPNAILKSVTLTEPFDNKIGFKKIEFFYSNLQEIVYLFDLNKWTVYKYHYE